MAYIFRASMYKGQRLTGHILTPGFLPLVPPQRTRNNRRPSAKPTCMSCQLGFIEPQLLTSVDQPPQGDEWLHEIKHDGYRTLLVVEGKRLLSERDQLPRPAQHQCNAAGLFRISGVIPGSYVLYFVMS